MDDLEIVARNQSTYPKKRTLVRTQMKYRDIRVYTVNDLRERMSPLRRGGGILFLGRLSPLP